MKNTSDSFDLISYHWNLCTTKALWNQEQLSWVTLVMEACIRFWYVMILFLNFSPQFCVSRLAALDIMLMTARHLPDDIILDRVIPCIVSSLRNYHSTYHYNCSVCSLWNLNLRQSGQADSRSVDENSHIAPHTHRFKLMYFNWDLNKSGIFLRALYWWKHAQDFDMLWFYFSTFLPSSVCPAVHALVMCDGQTSAWWHHPGWLLHHADDGILIG